jgi:hypothetical protein
LFIRPMRNVAFWYPRSQIVEEVWRGGKGITLCYVFRKTHHPSTLLSPSRFPLILLLSTHLLSAFHPPLLHSPLKRLNGPPKILALLLEYLAITYDISRFLGVRWSTVHKQIIMNTCQGQQSNMIPEDVDVLCISQSENSSGFPKTRILGSTLTTLTLKVSW